VLLPLSRRTFPAKPPPPAAIDTDPPLPNSLSVSPAERTILPVGPSGEVPEEINTEPEDIDPDPVRIIVSPLLTESAVSIDTVAPDPWTEDPPLIPKDPDENPDPLSRKTEPPLE